MGELFKRHLVKTKKYSVDEIICFLARLSNGDQYVLKVNKPLTLDQILDLLQMESSCSTHVKVLLSMPERNRCKFKKMIESGNLDGSDFAKTGLYSKYQKSLVESQLDMDPIIIKKITSSELYKMCMLQELGRTLDGCPQGVNPEDYKRFRTYSKKRYDTISQ